MYLRIGRASEAFPKVFPHVIARRNKLGPLPVYKEEVLVPLINMVNISLFLLIFGFYVLSVIFYSKISIKNIVVFMHVKEAYILKFY